MTRSVAVLLSVLAVAVVLAGTTSGVLLGRLTAPKRVLAASAPNPSTALPGSGLTAPGRGGGVAPAQPGGGGLTVTARVTGRSEDGMTVRYDASEPVAATIHWGAVAPLNQRTPAGSGRIGSARLTFATTALVSAQVEVRTADGRRATSNLVSGQRLVRQVVLDVTRATLRFPAGDGAGLVTAFLGTSLTPIRPGTPGPGASAHPYRFPARAVLPDTTSAVVDLRVVHRPAGGIDQTGTAAVLVPLPGKGTETVAYTDDVLGVQVTLDLRVTAILR
ncbi:MAG TPA: hypothetical protein VNK73_08825 [Actinomycetota bacterium]|nr:hypothetical protein [Actinomycetota bacterium]